MTVQGDVLKVEGGRVLTGLVAFDSIPLVQNSARDRIGDTSANLMGRWNHTLSNGSTTSLQIYGDYNSALAQGSLDKSRTFDVDFSHHVSIGSRNDIVWGAGARAVESDFVKGKNVAFLPPHRIDSLVSAFVQDEIRITDALSFTLGSKFEHNSYTGFEYEPSAQLAWEVTERQTIWASASRAIRQPARLDYGVLADLAAVPLDNGGFGIVQLQGTPHPKAEKMRDFELGHRAQLNKRVSLDSAAFVSLYHNLAAFEPGAAYFTTAEGPPHLVFPEVFDNKARGQDYGVEIFTNWNVINRWQLSPGYSWLHMRVTDPTGVGILREDPGLNPRHQPQLRSSLNLSRGLEWDASLAYTGRLNAIPAYTRFDTRIGWRASESIEFSLVGQNLLSPHHSEYPDADFITHTRVDRNVFGKVSWRF
jgi:iron complex outermembrane recepter protein